MEKLTLENIAPYLPYGLKGTFSTLPKGNIFTISGYETDDDEALEFIYIIGNCGPYGGQRDLIHNFIPYLRPMDLTKSIIVESKEVIPIVELARIAFPEDVWYLPENVKTALASTRAFWFDNNSFITEGYDCHKQETPNQLALFKWLYANKFDVEGLIEKGLAIDVTTLETNVYE